jgi:hypothetical protein
MQPSTEYLCLNPGLRPCASLQKGLCVSYVATSRRLQIARHRRLQRLDPSLFTLQRIQKVYEASETRLGAGDLITQFLANPLRRRKQLISQHTRTVLVVIAWRGEPSKVLMLTSQPE